MLLSEKEAMYGSKPSPRRSTSFRKTNEYLLSENGSVTPSSRQKTVDSATPELSTPRSYSGRQNMYFKEMKRLSTASLNFVAIAKEDSMSFSSVCCSEPESSPQNHQYSTLFFFLHESNQRYKFCDFFFWNPILLYFRSF